MRHVAEPVLLLAHADRDDWLAAAAAVVLDYEPQAPLFDPLASPLSFKDIAIDKGAIDDGLRAAASSSRASTAPAHQEQLYIETNGVIAVPWIGALDAAPSGRTPGMTVYGSLQCPYYVHKALVVALGLDAARVRVVQTETGGGFGGKEEYPSVLACHAAHPGPQGRRAGEDDLRPGRGSAGDDQAPSRRSSATAPA